MFWLGLCLLMKLSPPADMPTPSKDWSVGVNLGECTGGYTEGRLRLGERTDPPCPFRRFAACSGLRSNKKDFEDTKQPDQPACTQGKHFVSVHLPCCRCLDSLQAETVDATRHAKSLAAPWQSSTYPGLSSPIAEPLRSSRAVWFSRACCCAGAFLWPVHISSWSIRYGVGLESNRCRSDPRGDSISRWAPGDRGYYKQQQLKHQLQAPSRCSTTCVPETKKRPGNMHEHRSVLS